MSQRVVASPQLCDNSPKEVFDKQITLLLCLLHRLTGSKEMHCFRHKPKAWLQTEG